MMNKKTWITKWYFRGNRRIN